MNKKPTLSAALRGVETRPQEAGPQKEEVGTAFEDGKPRVGGVRPPSRLGKKTVAGHFDPAVSRQLRAIALEHDSTVQELLSEALNGLFEKYGKPPIA